MLKVLSLLLILISMYIESLQVRDTADAIAIKSVMTISFFVKWKGCYSICYVGRFSVVLNISI